MTFDITASLEVLFGLLAIIAVVGFILLSYHFITKRAKKWCPDLPTKDIIFCTYFVVILSIIAGFLAP